MELISTGTRADRIVPILAGGRTTYLWRRMRGMWHRVVEESHVSGLMSGEVEEILTL
jgi:hypothetical protein